MKQLLLLGALALFTLGFSSCGGTKYDPNNDPVTRMYDSMHRADSLRQWGPPKAITFADARDTTDLDESRVTIEGYVKVGSSIYESEYGVTIQLWERKNQVKGDYVGISLNTGSGNNEMKSLPDDYKTSDLTLKDDKGQAVGYGDKIRVTGIYSRPYGDGYGSVEVQTIEKIEDTPLDYSSLGAVKITTDTTGHAALEGKLVYAEGVMEIPTIVFIKETVYFDLFAKAGDDDYLTVDVLIGDGPDMVEDIPDDYSENDIKIHDHENNIVRKKKVRVYGIWQYNRIAAERIETL
jgi:hypothetical protein